MSKSVGILFAGFISGVLSCGYLLRDHIRLAGRQITQQEFNEERFIRISHEKAILSCVNGNGFVFMPGSEELERFVSCKASKICYERKGCK